MRPADELRPRPNASNASTASSARLSSTARPLLWAWVFLILYASLFPFDGWTLPPGLSPTRLLLLPWSSWRDRFDEVANLLGYVPFGALASVAAVRRGRGLGRAWVAAVLAALALSYVVEVAQVLLPTRVPSLKDTAFNVVGAALGAAAAVALFNGGVIEPWQRLRDRWFERGSSSALALLLLWPAALLSPLPVPLGLGHVWRGSASALADLADWAGATRFSDRAGAWVAALQQQPSGQPGTVGEVAIVALGVLGPTLLAFAVAPAVRRRSVLAAGVVTVAIAATTLATTLAFSPDHAMAWLTPRVGAGLFLGVLAAVVCMRLSSRAAAALALVFLAAQVLLLAVVPTDPYYAQSLSTWEQGRFVRFHGVAQWLAWIWPFAAGVWLLPRAARLRG